MNSVYTLVKGNKMYQLLKLLNPETAHNLAKFAMKYKLLAPGKTDGAIFLFGKEIPCRMGLAAGFDKNADIVDQVPSYGFGWTEVGSVTRLGGIGNQKPRMFRIEKSNDIMNRMGLNGQPVEIIETKLRAAKTTLYAVNIAKTHSPDIMGDDAIRDVVYTYSKLHSLGIYVVINISCPNTKEGKTFEDPFALRELLAAIGEVRKNYSRPILLKISPVFKDENIEQLINIVNEFKLNGFVACNTLPFEHPKFGKGGRSGSVVKPLALKLINILRARLSSTTIIGCGGIFTLEDVCDYIGAGVNAVQVYNGFIRGPFAGPEFVRNVGDLK